ncbi:phage tail tube protein [Paramagnetospirillum marisnigri]|nr:phage tail tube protein [Paramagnetospirillum marisnigri]
MAIETQGTKLGIQSSTGSVSVTFNATTHKIIRAAGDWTATFAVGDIVTTSDTDNPGPFFISALTATDMTVTGNAEGTVDADMTTDAVAASFTVTGYKPIGEITDFSGPGGSAAVINASSLDSIRQEKLMGLPDEGQISFSLNFVPGNAGQVAFRAARASRAETNFALVFSDASATAPATNATFAGFALEFSVAGAVDDKVSGSATIEITGAVTWSDE